MKDRTCAGFERREGPDDPETPASDLTKKLIEDGMVGAGPRISMCLEYRGRVHSRLISADVLRAVLPEGWHALTTARLADLLREAGL